MLLGVEAELAENLFGVLAEAGRAPGRNLVDAMHLDRTADRRGQLVARAVERNDDLVRRQLRIVDHLLRSANFAKRDVHASKYRMPVRHGLCAEYLVKDRRELRHVRDQLRRIGKARIGQQVGAADCIRYGRKLVGRDDEDEPGAVGGTIDVHRGIGGMLCGHAAEETWRRARAAWIETLADHTPSASSDVVTYEPLPVRSRR